MKASRKNKRRRIYDFIILHSEKIKAISEDDKIPGSLREELQSEVDQIIDQIPKPPKDKYPIFIMDSDNSKLKEIKVLFKPREIKINNADRVLRNLDKKTYPIQETSLLAYAKVLEHLSERQLAVLKCLDTFYSATNMMIARKLGWDINRVTPRIWELRQMKLVYEDKKDVCKITGETSIYWKFKKK